jgi:hypothetical protein
MLRIDCIDEYVLLFVNIKSIYILVIMHHIVSKSCCLLQRLNNNSGGTTTSVADTGTADLALLLL